ncbi:altronate oxidoreductase [Bacillus sp. FJAT-25509]|uniref:tagaturonate reductase n=1 Tax=Bacillus sp. FJAT-25509 TaxID=1712029 RepID=UPI0006FE9FB4|nr:tagaturonate reductase [Bacillus sp. FJAT-25509]KQL41791.1 altronate oxidoreductase [Bacillus sp. FJAT-25509]
MQKLNRKNYKEFRIYPEKILQFGEGNFLRAFVDWQVQILNEKTDFNGSVVIVQPRGSGKIERLNRQDGLFTLYLQGIRDGYPVNEHMVIDSINRGINLFNDYQAFKELSEKKELRFIISNTTEAGIAYDPTDKLTDQPQKSFPGKLTAFLFHRFKAFSGDPKRGCIIIPCELIEYNGTILKELVLKYAQNWNLGSEFINWIEQANTFCSSLVDRIVPGFPSDTYSEKTEVLGYQDELMVVGEQYHLWVIEGPESIKHELPFDGTGLNTLIVKDLSPFRTRKVRILNGAHTAMTPIAYLSGLEIVEDAVSDKEVGSFIRELIIEEIIPTLEGNTADHENYAEEVLTRFANPFIRHYLMSISLNSTSKFITRNLPTLIEYIEKTNVLPPRMVFALSCLIYFYRGKRGEENISLQDQTETLEFFKTTWEMYENKKIDLNMLAEKVLSEKKIWEMNLNTISNLKDTVTKHLSLIEQFGVRNALIELSLTSIHK